MTLAMIQNDAETSQSDVDIDLSYTADASTFNRHYRTVSAARSSESGIAHVLHPIQSHLFPQNILFGVELEFNSGDLEEVARTMYNRRYTAVRHAQEYHARDSNAPNPDSPSAHERTWRAESDCSVSGGEIISPPMYANLATLDALTEVVNTITDNDGTANTSRSAGMHIHVSSDSLGANVEKWNRLFTIFSTFEDTLFRLAANPFRSGAHRNNGYSHGVGEIRTFESVSQMFGSTNISSRSAVNINNVRRNGTGHIEFRLWDASLSIPVIHTHILLSLALVEAASRPEIDVILRHTEKQAKGFRRSALKEREMTPSAKLTGDDWKEATANVRTLLDILFPHSEVKKAQVATLFAMNKVWAFGNR